MDSELIHKHLEWVKSVESTYHYVEAESDSEEFAAFFSVAGRVAGGALGMGLGGWVASGALAAVFGKLGEKLDKKVGL